MGKESDSLSFIRTASEIAGTHHEKFDGSGYPLGLKGKEIPLSGRLMAIIDVYDALVNKRVYKPEFSHEEAMRMIGDDRGKHFDPDITDSFFTDSGGGQGDCRESMRSNRNDKRAEPPKQRRQTARRIGGNPERSNA